MAHPQIIMKDEPIQIMGAKSSEIINPFEVNTVAIEHVGDNTIYKYRQTIGDILNNNEEERKEGRNDNPSEWRKCASVPEVTWLVWESLGITADETELRKALERNRNELMTTNKKLI